MPLRLNLHVRVARQHQRYVHLGQAIDPAQMAIGSIPKPYFGFCETTLLRSLTMMKLFTKNVAKDFVLLVALFLSVQGASACTIFLSSLKRLDKGEYVFFGEVTGYSSLVPGCSATKGQCAISWGLEMSVLSAVQLPRPEVTKVKIYPFGLNAMCGPIPMSKQQMEQFKVGTRYKVIASPLHANLVGNGSPRSDLPLLDGSGWNSAEIIPIPSGADISALRNSETDYLSPTKDRYPSWNFELRKDLVRLSTATSMQDTLATLRRLANFRWRKGYSDPPDTPDPFMALVRIHVSDANAIEELQRRRDATRFFNDEMQGLAAKDFLLERAERGEPEFQFQLGLLLARSDQKAAATWFEKAGKQGFVAADFQLGRLYQDMAQKATGEQRTKFKALADQVFLHAARVGVKLAEQGDASAALMLAEMHDKSLGGLKSDEAVVRYACLGMKNKPRGYPIGWLHENANCN